MTFIKNTNKKNTHPHVKWGSLIVSMIFLFLEIALIVLHFYANSGAMTDANIGLGFVAAYGWLGGLLGLLAASALFFEEFLPSYIKYTTWKNYRNYKANVVKATRASVLSNIKKENRDYLELLEAMR